MIASFRNRNLERFWIKGETRRLDARHIAKLMLILSALDHALKPEDLNLPGWGFHRLSGDQSGRYAVNAVDVDYEDYH
jgi:proteic killer suppression protein